MRVSWASASSAWVPSDSQIMVGFTPSDTIASISGSNSGPKTVSSKVRCRFSPPVVYSIFEKWQCSRSGGFGRFFGRDAVKHALIVVSRVENAASFTCVHMAEIHHRDDGFICLAERKHLIKRTELTDLAHGLDAELKAIQTGLLQFFERVSQRVGGIFGGKRPSSFAQDPAWMTMVSPPISFNAFALSRI